MADDNRFIPPQVKKYDPVFASRGIRILSSPLAAVAQQALDTANQASGTKSSWMDEAVATQRQMYDQDAPTPATPELLRYIRQNPPEA